MSNNMSSSESTDWATETITIYADDYLTTTGATGSAIDIDWGISPTYTFSNIGAAGQVYTTNGTGGAGWTTTISADPNLQGKTLQVNGDADITGELTVQGIKLSDRLDKIDERLAILHPNEELEAKWENLRGLRKAYMELEAEIKEKEKMWGILKK
jgi:hypothetical protein